MQPLSRIFSHRCHWEKRWGIARGMVQEKGGSDLVNPFPRRHRRFSQFLRLWIHEINTYWSAEGNWTETGTTYRCPIHPTPISPLFLSPLRHVEVDEDSRVMSSLVVDERVGNSMVGSSGTWSVFCRFCNVSSHIFDSGSVPYIPEFMNRRKLE
jgi:hypothetical protein